MEHGYGCASIYMCVCVCVCVCVWYSLLWGCCVVKSHEDRMKESTSCAKLSFDTHVETHVDNQTRTRMQTHENVNMM
jgi:hypothetical protein